MGEAEAHSAIDKLENPIKLTEQGIRDLKKDLDKSLHALAEVKALEIRSRNDANKETSATRTLCVMRLSRAQKVITQVSSRLPRQTRTF